MGIGRGEDQSAPYIVFQMVACIKVVLDWLCLVLGILFKICSSSRQGVNMLCITKCT